MSSSPKRTRFFGGQAQRLQREDVGWTADLLAEELYAMPREPIVTDGPITINWNGNEPAIRIIQTGPDDPTSPMITIQRPDGTIEEFPPPGGGGGGGGGGGDNNPDDTTPGGGGGGGGGTITPQPPPGPTPGRIFTGTVQIIIHQPAPDPFGWDGQEPIFTSTECRPYNPPGIPAPTTALAMPGILTQIDNFRSHNGLTGSYTVLTDSVSAPGASCSP